MNLNTQKLFRKNRGMSLFEILIGCTIVTVGILAIIDAYSVYVKYALTHDGKVEATYLLEEGVEAMSLLRDSGWTANITPLVPATTYYLTFNGTSWVTTTVPQYVEGSFLRKVNIAAVNRDTSGMINTVGTNDTGTKLITVTVEYPQSNGTTTVSLSKYLVNMYAN